jgi:uncharacterized protein YndB with AHSA1/START domain
MTDIADSADERGEIRVTRFFAGVQPERIFKAYTTPAELAEFFAPKGLSIDIDSVVIEPHVGGRFECTMVFDETGEGEASIGVLIEVEAPNRIVGTEPDSGMISAQTFTAVEGGTELVVHQTNVPSQYLTPEVEPAFQSSFDKLQALLDRETSSPRFEQ